MFFSTSSATAETLDFGGSLSSSYGVYLFSCTPNCFFLDYQNRNVLDLELDADLGPSVAARAAVRLSNENIPDVRRVEDTGDSNNLQPVLLRVTDAWVEGYDVGIDGLDVRVGAQTERWGTGVGYSPLDRLNPFDFEDPMSFDKRLALPAARASYYTNDLTFSAIWFPFFVPSLINPRVLEGVTGSGAADDIDFGESMEGDGPEVDQVRTRIELPGQYISESSLALRAEWAASKADVAVGWYYGRDSLPQLSGEVIPENFFSGDTTDLVVNLQYPRMQMIAAEAVAPFGDSWTAWIDAALVLPTRTTIFISQSRLEDLERLNAIDEAPDEGISAEIQSGKPFVNILAGVDTSIGSKLYLNFQYIHGFLFERNPEDLHHYGLVGLRTPAMEGPFELEARAGVEANRAFDAFGFLTQLQLTYRHADILEFSASGTLQGGQEGTTLGIFTGLSEVRVKAEAFF